MDAQPPLNLPEAPAWAIATGEAGRWCIYLAFALFLLSAVGYWFGSPSFERWPQRFFTFGCLALFGAFGLLASLFVTDQFEFQYVFSHSDALAAMPYKVAAIWSGQEGSFLLWACTSAIFGLLVAPRTAQFRRWFTVPYAFFLAGLAGILSYETPFTMPLIDGRHLVPPTGAGMAPSLMNYWVTIHPPTIFLGFGSLAVLFCWALSAMVNRDLKSWVPLIRPWAIVSTTLLGLGLTMGGFWAYETLGWGGFWAWDPVENVSFVPWCLSVAFLHGIFVQTAKGKWILGNAILAASAFLSFVYGTFLTRSGFLGDTSVHSFAEMNRTALWLLVAILGAGLLAFGWQYFSRLIQFRRQPQIESAPDEDATLFSKRNAYGVAIWLMVAFALGAGVGMSWPLVTSIALSKPLVVEAPLYHKVFSWFFLFTMLGMALGPWLSWRGTGFRALATRLSNIVALTLGLLGLIVIWIKLPDHGVGLEPGASIQMPFGMSAPLVPWMATLIGFSLFALLSNLWFGIERIRRSPGSLGGIVMHLGVIVTLTGLIVSRGFERSARFGVQDGHPATALGYTVSYLGPTKTDLADRDNKIRFVVDSPSEKFEATPGLYYIPRDDQPPSPMVWPYIHRHPFYDLYFSLGPMVFEATDPITFKVGESKLFQEEKMLLTYRRMAVQGTPGTVGVKFGAVMELKSASGTITATPTFQVGKDGPVFEEARLNDSLSIKLLRIDAKDKSVTVQLNYATPLFPVELFYKPMTILVWLGAGIMAIGGTLAALYRRNRPKMAVAEPGREAEDIRAAV